MTEAPYVSAARAARAIGCTKQWICELARDGEIVGAFKLDGGPWCIPRGWVGDALLAKLILDDAVSDRKPEPSSCAPPTSIGGVAVLLASPPPRSSRTPRPRKRERAANLS